MWSGLERVDGWVRGHLAYVAIVYAAIQYGRLLDRYAR